MTEKRYKMVNTNLVDDEGLVYYLIKRDGNDVCQVFGKHTAKKIIDELNALHEENQQLQSQITYLETKIQRERNSNQKQHEKWDKETQEKINAIYEENQQLQKENLQLLGLLGDIRALLRTNNTDTIINKINQIEKELLKK